MEEEKEKEENRASLRGGEESSALLAKYRMFSVVAAGSSRNYCFVCPTMDIIIYDLKSKDRKAKHF